MSATDSLQNTLLQVVDAAEAAGQPDRLYRAVDHALGQLVGHKLFTMMVLARDGEKVRRVYSNQPAAYPTGGFKTHRETPWGRQVLGTGRAYIGHDADDIRWAFADFQQIFALGCESVLNMPVKWDGTVIGTINLLDVAGRYREADIDLVRPYAALLVPAFEREIARGG